MSPPIVAVVPCQSGRINLPDSLQSDVTAYTVHLVRASTTGTPGPMLCGTPRSGPDAPGWSLRGGVTGPNVIQQPCPGCILAWTEQHPDLDCRDGGGAAELRTARTILDRVRADANTVLDDDPTAGTGWTRQPTAGSLGLCGPDALARARQERDHTAPDTTEQP